MSICSVDQSDMLTVFGVQTYVSKVYTCLEQQERQKQKHNLNNFLVILGTNATALRVQQQKLKLSNKTLHIM